MQSEKKHSAVNNKDNQTIQFKNNNKKSKRLTWFLSILAVTLLFNTFNIIQEGFIGVKKRLGKIQNVLAPGFHLKIPFIDRVEILETRMRRITYESQATNADQIEIKLQLTANWHLPSASVTTFYQKHGNQKQYEQRVLIPLLNASSHGLISQYTTNELLKKRDVISSLISNAMERTSHFAPARLDSVQIEKFILPESYQKGIEAKLAQLQVLETEKLKVNKEKIKAQADSDISEIKAKALIKQSEANAKAMLIEGEAKAKVIKKIISAIKDSRSYVQYEKIQKWDGKLSNSTANPNTIFKSVEK